jgi:hypothetical protein
VAPAPVPGGAYYFYDCQQAGCVPGNNADAGTTPSAPKRDLSGFNVNALPAGTQLLFARGGVWNWTQLTLDNLNVTPSAPLVFDAYGSGPAPVWLTTSGSAINFGDWQNTSNDSGYTFRNLKLDGAGSGQWGFFLHDLVSHVTLENLEITGFAIGVHAAGVSGAPSPSFLTVRDSNLHLNRQHGILGGADNMVLEGNTVANNNMDGGTFEHGFYLSKGTNVIVRNNRFLRNSAPGGVCNGGNLTLHGQLDGWLIEGNRIEQDSALGGCYGLSITTGYSTAEWFRNFTVRGNTIINVGYCAICAGSAPGIVVEDNKIINTQNTGQTGVQIPTGTPGAGDETDRDVIVRNNTMCFVNPSNTGVSANVPGAQVSNNTVITGAAATTGVCTP